MGALKLAYTENYSPLKVAYSKAFRESKNTQSYLRVDPLAKVYSFYSPYQFAGNKPINSIDIDGLEESLVINYTSVMGNMSTTGTIELFGADEVYSGQIEQFAKNMGIDSDKLWGLIPNNGGVSVDMIVNSGQITGFRATSLDAVSVVEDRYTSLEKFGNALEDVIRPGSSTTFAWEGHSDQANTGYTTEQDVKVGLAVVSAVFTCGAAYEIYAGIELANTLNISTTALSALDAVDALGTNSYGESLGTQLTKGSSIGTGVYGVFSVISGIFQTTASAVKLVEKGGLTIENVTDTFNSTIETIDTGVEQMDNLINGDDKK